MSATDTGLEVLKGTLLTPEGWNGIRDFREAKERPTHLVIEEAFTHYCEDVLSQEDQRIFTIDNPPSSKLMPLIDFLVETCIEGVDPRAGTSRSWRKVDGLQLHVDFELGHTAVSNFGVEGHPYMELYDEIIEEPVLWENTGFSSGISHSIPVSPDKKKVVPLKNRQLILLSGTAIEAVEYDACNQTLRAGLASLPHEIFVDEPEDQRLRLMVQGIKPRGLA